MGTRRHFLASSTGFLALSACAGPLAGVALGPEGQPLPVLYRIAPDAAPSIQARVRERLASLRAADGAPPLQLDAALTAAAAAHSRDMSRQGQPVHVGSDGSSPIERAARAGYRGLVLGETVAETFAPELETLADWMAQADTRAVIMDPDGRDLGVGHFQDDGGKIWWTLLVGAGDSAGSSAR